MHRHVVQKHHHKCQVGHSTERCSFSSLCPKKLDEHRKTECQERLVPCPGESCEALVKCKEVKQHLMDTHGTKENKRVHQTFLGPNEFSPPHYSGSLDLVPYYSEHLVSCFNRSPKDHLFYFWFHFIGSQSEAKRHTVDMQVIDTRGGELFKFTNLNVFSIDVTREEVWKSGKALCFPECMVAEWMTEEGVTYIKKREGYSHTLSIKFYVREKYW